jgi:AhpD family alkylhydroperoxidase
MASSTKDILEQIQKNVPRLTKAHRKLGTAFMQELAPAVLSDGALSLKHKELIALGIAISSQCEYCIAAHLKKCLDAGVTREEIVEVCGVAVLMGGGPALMYGSRTMEMLDDLTE